MKKNFVKTLIMAMAVTAMVGTTGITSQAAEATTTSTQAVVKQNLNKAVVAQVFDAKYYAEKNPDVVAVIGTDANALLAHYMNFGIYEGRDASENFNATIYAAANGDLEAVFGDNIEALIEHYLTLGVNENRIASNAQLEAVGYKYVPSYGATTTTQTTSTGTATAGVKSYGSFVSDPTWNAEKQAAYETEVAKIWHDQLSTFLTPTQMASYDAQRNLENTKQALMNAMDAAIKNGTMQNGEYSSDSTDAGVQAAHKAYNEAVRAADAAAYAVNEEIAVNDPSAAAAQQEAMNQLSSGEIVDNFASDSEAAAAAIENGAIEASSGWDAYYAIYGE